MHRRRFLKAMGIASAAILTVGAKALKPQRQWRIVQVHRGGHWVTVGLGDIRAGDRFRMFEPDGKPVMEGGHSVFIAQSDAVPIEPQGNHSVAIKKG